MPPDTAYSTDVTGAGIAAGNMAVTILEASDTAAPTGDAPAATPSRACSGALRCHTDSR